MMGWVGSGEDFCGLGWVELGPEILCWVGLGFEKVTHDQLWSNGRSAVELQSNGSRNEVQSLSIRI